MGLVRVQASIGRSREETRDVRFLVDTGSFYSAVPQALRDELRLIPGMPTQVMLADGRIVDAELTLAYLKIHGREAGIPVEIVNVPEPLLGVTALEATGLKVNPVTQELEVVSPFERPPLLKRFHQFPRDP
jgi:clan AA aspartic protease